MMRIYIRTDTRKALKMLSDGFTDMHEDAPLGLAGVWCEDRPRNGERECAAGGVLMTGTNGDTVLCLDVPEELFRKFEVSEGTRQLTDDEAKHYYATGEMPEYLECRTMGYAIIPAAELNQHGKPKVFDQKFSGSTRHEMLKAIRAWEEAQAATEGSTEGCVRHIQAMRDAVEFFDAIGWQTPLSLRESAPDDYIEPKDWFRMGVNLDPE
jgi:hypothetical protein